MPARIRVEWDNHFAKGFKVVPDERGASHFDITVPFDPQADTTYFLLSLTYTTGDSEGREPGLMHEIIDLYEDITLGRDNARRIREFIDSEWEFRNGKVVKQRRWANPDPKVHGIMLLGHDRVERSCDASLWDGYFERIEEIILDSVEVLVDPRPTRWTF